MRVWKIGEIQPPVTIEWDDPDIVCVVRHRIVRKAWHNLETENGDWPLVADNQVVWSKNSRG